MCVGAIICQRGIVKYLMATAFVVVKAYPEQESERERERECVSRRVIYDRQIGGRVFREMSESGNLKDLIWDLRGREEGKGEWVLDLTFIYYS